MTMKSRIRKASLLLGSMAIVFPAHVAAQSAGRIEFTARVAPTGGRPEPVRQLTFFLLRRSLEDVRAEVLQDVPAPDLAKFIDGLGESPELKMWMKKHHTVELAGGDFTRSLTPDDIVDVPEFFNAYMSRNMGYKGVGFPNPKFKEKDRDSNPEKYAQEKEEYKTAIRKFIAAVPESVDGIDVDLTDLNPYPKWDTLVRRQRQMADSHTIERAEERYVAAQTDTDLDGHGTFAGVAPGSYWIGMLGAEAIAGDVRLRWDFPVTVRPNEATHIALSNINAVKPATAAQIPNN